MLDACPKRFAFALLMLAPALAWTEGAVRHLECVVVRACDGSGSCAPEDGKVTFSMSPVSTAPDGSGRFEIKYGAVSAPMQALSDVGPFYWKIRDEYNTLLVNSERGMLWHQLNIGASASAKVWFMTCRFQP